MIKIQTQTQTHDSGPMVAPNTARSMNKPIQLNSLQLAQIELMLMKGYYISVYVFYKTTNQDRKESDEDANNERLKFFGILEI